MAGLGTLCYVMAIILLIVFLFTAWVPIMNVMVLVVMLGFVGAGYVLKRQARKSQVLRQQGH